MSSQAKNEPPEVEFRHQADVSSLSAGSSPSKSDGTDNGGSGGADNADNASVGDAFKVPDAKSIVQKYTNCKASGSIHTESKDTETSPFTVDASIRGKFGGPLDGNDDSNTVHTSNCKQTKPPAAKTTGFFSKMTGWSGWLFKRSSSTATKSDPLAKGTSLPPGERLSPKDQKDNAPPAKETSPPPGDGKQAPSTNDQKSKDQAAFTHEKISVETVDDEEPNKAPPAKGTSPPPDERKLAPPTKGKEPDAPPAPSLPIHQILKVASATAITPNTACVNNGSASSQASSSKIDESNGGTNGLASSQAGSATSGQEPASERAEGGSNGSASSQAESNGIVPRTIPYETWTMENIMADIKSQLTDDEIAAFSSRLPMSQNDTRLEIFAQGVIAFKEVALIEFSVEERQALKDYKVKMFDKGVFNFLNGSAARIVMAVIFGWQSLPQKKLSDDELSDYFDSIILPAVRYLCSSLNPNGVLELDDILNRNVYRFCKSMEARAKLGVWSLTWLSTNRRTNKDSCNGNGFFYPFVAFGVKHFDKGFYELIYEAKVQGKVWVGPGELTAREITEMKSYADISVPLQDGMVRGLVDVTINPEVDVRVRGLWELQLQAVAQQSRNRGRGGVRRQLDMGEGSQQSAKRHRGK